MKLVERHAPRAAGRKLNFKKKPPFQVNTKAILNDINGTTKAQAPPKEKQPPQQTHKTSSKENQTSLKENQTCSQNKKISCQY